MKHYKFIVHRPLSKNDIVVPNHLLLVCAVMLLGWKWL
uniref:Uncharacterized protein n=1 Tax=Rhizophora mucronata TaxID=61149 RepID=A0A2P2PT10_RHIMU